MAQFKQNITNLYSKERLQGYESIAQHDENLNFIGIISPKIAKIEIALRNMLDFALGGASTAWLLASNDEYLQDKIAEIQKKNADKVPLSHHQVLSRLTLGAVVRLIKENKLQNALFDASSLNLKAYSPHNKDFFRRKGKKYPLSNISKTDSILSLLLNIRNRAFHWENLLKIVEIDGNKVSRLYTSVQGVIISINPSKIELFLDGLLGQINEKFLEK